MEKQGALETSISKRGVTLTNRVAFTYIVCHCTGMVVVA